MNFPSDPDTTYRKLELVYDPNFFVEALSTSPIYPVERLTALVC